ncbi:SH3 domain-containing protein [Persicobacter psychrovividus]|uniref:SH3b domain-containing protein n=1 Tax=Persicobacter psychrovividus TaxID=387638 RepID=A0ABM7VEF6_9BACT|nr:hypothetical protein PEPS_13530 [Persicobacter psychrovividus]
MPKFFFTVFLLSVNIAYGQGFQNGLILPTQGFNQEICCIYSPKEGFNVYDNPNGEVVGRITRNVAQNVGDQSFYRIYHINHQTKAENQIDLKFFKEIGYEIWAIPYSQREKEFVKFSYSNQDLWLKQSEIEALGFKLVGWESFLMANMDNLLGYYANGLNLREKPNIDSRIIRNLKGETNQIVLTNEKNGTWTKVKIIIHKKHPCVTNLSEKENIIEELEGWLKIVDCNGLPNIWYYSRGC